MEDIQQEPSPQHIEARAIEHTWFRQAEIANMWTHFSAFVLGVFAFHALMDKSFVTGNTTIIFANVVYGLCVLFTFLTSSIYHALTHPRLKEVFHFLDHFLIYLMIAGTYTPFTLILLEKPWNSIFCLSIWSLAIMGIISVCFLMHKARRLSTVLYVLMGWVGVIAIIPILHILPSSALFWLVGGGIIYTLGVIFYLLESVPFSHTIWHLFVIMGAIFQFVCIYYYVIPNH